MSEIPLDDPELSGRDVSRRDTAIRLLYTVLYVLIWNVVEAVLLVVIVFDLLFALITQREPGARARRFANAALSYAFRIGRYLTYNDPQPPFPFAEWPPEVEPGGGLEDEDAAAEPL